MIADDYPTQRTVSASGAPRLHTNGVSSPFAMAVARAGTAASARAVSPPEPAAHKRSSPRGDMKARMMQALQARGPLNNAQLADAIAVTPRQASDLFSNGCIRGYIVRLGIKHEGRPLYDLAPTAAQPLDAQDKANAAKGADTAPQASHASKPSPNAPQTPTPTPTAPSTARWGLFSDGVLHIEAAGKQIELLPSDVRALRAYLQAHGGAAPD